MIGLLKTEVIRQAGPWSSLDDVEYATLEWVAWFNSCRLMEPLGYVPHRNMRISLICSQQHLRLLGHSTN